jgi:mono/diheme cytochrome c family protein
MTAYLSKLLVLRGVVVGTAFGIAVVANPATAQGRGELLYATHCSACHTVQLHWRASKAVTDWTSLRSEVRKWQGEAKLAWGEDDVLDVARYLNDNIYHFVLPSATAMTTSPTVGPMWAR